MRCGILDTSICENDSAATMSLSLAEADLLIR